MTIGAGAFTLSIHIYRTEFFAMAVDPDRAARVAALVMAPHGVDFKFWAIMAACFVLPLLDHVARFALRAWSYLRKRASRPASNKQTVGGLVEAPARD